MSAKRMGEILQTIVPLSPHDIEEILSEQRLTHRRFGDCAIALGLCRPEHVWQAYGGQLGQASRQIDDLDAFGVDAQAIAYLPAELARELHVIPVRFLDGAVVVAADPQDIDRAREALSQRLDVVIHFVGADRGQVDRAIAYYYPTTCPAEKTPAIADELVRRSMHGVVSKTAARKRAG